MATRPMRLILMTSAACGLLLAACGKKDDRTATLGSVDTSLPAGTESGNASLLSTPTAGQATATTGAGTAVGGASSSVATTDVAQTAAVSPAANSNGSLPSSPGVGPAGGASAVAANAATAGVAAAAMAPTRAVTPGATGSSRAVTPVGGALGGTGTLSSPGRAAGAVPR